jgi:hypothetical protein
MTDEGYFVKSIDPDGTRHGVYGAPKYGYFEAAPNHDAIAFRVVDDVQATRIYSKIASIPGLRPYDLIITNYPSLDDMYEQPKGLWRFGNWVNGGHWSTCEARMMLGYYRLGKYEDARRSMKRIVGFAERFRMDNNLTNFGSEPYQPKLPINTVYDTYAVPAGLVRGLFEYLYRADGLTVLPHIPPGITELEQRFPVRFGSRRLYLATYGSGPVTGVLVNGRRWKTFTAESVSFAPDSLPDEARVQILLDHAKAGKMRGESMAAGPANVEAGDEARAALDARAAKMTAFRGRLAAAGMGASYEAAHAQLVVDMVRATHERFKLIRSGKLKPLPEPSQSTADKLYVDTANHLFNGLEKTIKGYEKATDPRQKAVYAAFQ